MVATAPKVRKETYEHATNEVSFDQFQNADYGSHLYQYHGVLKGIDGFAAYDGNTEECRAYFDEHGFLAIEGAFTSEEVQSSLGLRNVLTR